MEKKIKELTLLLMYLTSWEEKGFIRNENDEIKEGKVKICWKGYSFDVINELTNRGYLFPSKYKNKSVTFTKDGMDLAEKLLKEYIK